MARQTGGVFLCGTVGDLCFYQLEGGYYVRRKSRLNRKRFFADAAFAASRKSASELAFASRLASILYRQLPVEKKGRSVYLALTGAIKKKRKAGVSETGIRNWFYTSYLSDRMPACSKSTEKFSGSLQPNTSIPVPIPFKNKLQNAISWAQQKTNAPGLCHTDSRLIRLPVRSGGFLSPSGLRKTACQTKRNSRCGLYLSPHKFHLPASRLHPRYSPIFMQL